MIIWKDFIIDDFLGPTLADQSRVASAVDGLTGCRAEGVVRSGVMEDARMAIEAQGCASIQETGQGQRPARMVGKSSLDAVRFGMEADRCEPRPARLREEG